jgi:hypothetical protein
MVSDINDSYLKNNYLNKPEDTKIYTTVNHLKQAIYNSTLLSPIFIIFAFGLFDLIIGNIGLREAKTTGPYGGDFEGYEVIFIGISLIIVSILFAIIVYSTYGRNSFIESKTNDIFKLYHFSAYFFEIVKKRTNIKFYVAFLVCSILLGYFSGFFVYNSPLVASFIYWLVEAFSVARVVKSP